MSARRILLVVAVAGASTLALALPAAAYHGSGFDVRHVARSGFHQDVDVDFEDALLALALDGDIEDVLDVDVRSTFRGHFDRGFDIDEDEALFLLAFGGGFGDLFDDDHFGGFDHVFGPSIFRLHHGQRHHGFGHGFDFDDRFRGSSSFHRHVDLDPDVVLAALALGGGADVLDLADFHQSSRVFTSLDRDVDFDHDEFLFLLALDDHFDLD